ncbi:MAG: glycosyltransferase family 4 protein [Candidatus Helarchaeota archaeon]
MKLLMMGELPPSKSGIAFHVYNISNALKSKGIQVINVNISSLDTPNAFNLTKNPSKRAIFKSILSLLLKYPKESPRFFYYTLKNILFRGFRIFYWVWNTLKIFKRYKIDIIHCHSMPAAYICDLLSFFNIKIPKVLTIHGNDIILLPRIPRYKKAVIFSYKRMDIIIAVSDELADLTRKYVNKTVIYIPNGVNIELFNPNINNIEFLKKFNVKTNIILSPRNFWVKYGYEILIRTLPYILKEVPEVKLILTGNPERDPEYSRKFFELVDKLGVQNSIILSGWVSYDDMPKLYSIADVVVFPSLAEAVCLTALEAMAMEKPIVSTAVGGFPEIIQDSYNGYIVDIVGKSSQYASAFSLEEEKIKKFAEKIIILLKDKKKREEMGKNARKSIISSYSWNKIADRTITIYKQLINKNKSI